MTLVDLGENPGLGHLRKDLTPADRTLRYQTVLKRVVIVYQPDVIPIRVVGVFDGAKDIAAILPERDYDWFDLTNPASAARSFPRCRVAGPLAGRRRAWG